MVILFVFFLFQDKFQWEDGSPATFTSWSTNEPNGPLDLNGVIVMENCVEMYMYYGTWNDLSCNYTRYFVCEKSTGNACSYFEFK